MQENGPCKLVISSGTTEIGTILLPTNVITNQELVVKLVSPFASALHDFHPVLASWTNNQQHQKTPGPSYAKMAQLFAHTVKATPFIQYTEKEKEKEKQEKEKQTVPCLNICSNGFQCDKKDCPKIHGKEESHQKANRIKMFGNRKSRTRLFGSKLCSPSLFGLCTQWNSGECPYRHLKELYAPSSEQMEEIRQHLKQYRNKTPCHERPKQLSQRVAVTKADVQQQTREILCNLIALFFGGDLDIAHSKEFTTEEIEIALEWSTTCEPFVGDVVEFAQQYKKVFVVHQERILLTDEAFQTGHRVRQRQLDEQELLQK